MPSILGADCVCADGGKKTCRDALQRLKRRRRESVGGMACVRGGGGDGGGWDDACLSVCGWMVGWGVYCKAGWVLPRCLVPACAQHSSAQRALHSQTSLPSGHGTCACRLWLTTSSLIQSCASLHPVMLFSPPLMLFPHPERTPTLLLPRLETQHQKLQTESDVAAAAGAGAETAGTTGCGDG